MAFTSANDINILQSSDAAVVGAGAGNDTYVLSPSTLSANQEVTISDTQGTNKLQLIGGLTIASSTVASNAVLLTLSNGAKVTVLGADTFSYEVGGNPLTATAGTVQTYAQFATTTLGAASVPTTGTAAGTANVTIAGGSTGTTAGQAFSLTTATETKTLTSGNDTVDGSTVVDSVSGDTVIDSSTTDTDVANLVVSGTISPANMLNVETVNGTAKYGSVVFDGSKFIGTKTFNLDSAIASGTAEVTSNTATTIAAKTNISTLKVTNGAAGATVAVDGGAATTVSVTGAAGADTFTVALAAGTNTVTIDGNAGTDAYTLNLKGGTLALTGNSTNNETLALNVSTGAQTINATTGLAKTTTVAGDQNVTIKGDEAVFDTFTLTNSLASGKTLDLVVTAASTATDLTKIAASTIELQALSTSAKFAAGANVKLGAAALAGALNGTTSLNVDLLKASTGALTTDLATVNFTANTVAVTSLDSQLGTDATTNIAGTKAVTLAATYTAKAVDATNLSGVLTATAIGETGRVNITGGSGNDKFTLGTVAAATTINGGAGDDTITSAALADFKLVVDGGAGTSDKLAITSDTTFNQAAAKTSVITGIELIDIASTKTLTLTQKQLFTNGADFTLSGTGTLAIVDDTTSSTVFNLGSVKFTPGDATAVTITGHATTGSTITGSASADSIVGGAGADTINGGTGADTIKGAAGADVINVGTGTDIVQYGAAAETFASAITSGTTVLTGIDVISGMAAGDALSLFSDAGITTATTVGTSIMSAGTANAAAIVKGDYNATTGIFTTSTTGADSLVQWDSNGTAASGNVESIILVGFAGSLTATANTLTLA